MDIINEFFQRHYPADAETAWEMRSCGNDYWRDYNGTDRDRRIFPAIVCADGFTMSVQGHFGAYSYPRDDFAEEYFQVEVMCPREPILDGGPGGHECGDEMIYGYVPIATVLKVIDKHGGIVPAEPSK